MTDKQVFKPIKDITARKITGHLKRNEIVFLVCKNPENSKYIIVSYVIKNINGREWLSIWQSCHAQQNTPTITVLVNNQAEDLDEWIELLNKGVGKAGVIGLEYSIKEYFEKDVLGGGDYAFPRNAEFYGYTSENAGEYGMGIEEKFAEYWFKKEKSKMTVQ